MPQDQLLSLVLEQHRAILSEVKALREDLTPLRDEVTAIKAKLETEDKIKTRTGTTIQAWIAIAASSIISFASLLLTLFKHEAHK